jgi:hypothetical protein
MASTPSIPSTLERITYGAPAGAIIQGQHRQIISGVGATRTLAARESGALCLFDRAAGIVYTLPPPVVGMFFEFATVTTITSNAAKVITDAATTFLLGSVDMLINTSATTLAALANGTTHIAISSNGSTTGGVQGDRYRVTAISSTQWVIDGQVSGSGTLATPMSIS